MFLCDSHARDVYFPVNQELVFLRLQSSAATIFFFSFFSYLCFFAQHAHLQWFSFRCGLPNKYEIDDNAQIVFIFFRNDVLTEIRFVRTALSLLLLILIYRAHSIELSQACWHAIVHFHNMKSRTPPNDWAPNATLFLTLVGPRIVIVHFVNTSYR